MAGKRVRLRGFNELARGIQTGLVPALGVTAEDVGYTTAQLVAGHTRAILPHRSGRLAASVAAEKLQGQWSGGTFRPPGGRAKYDGSVPYDGVIDFGGYHGRPYRSTGRYLYPTGRAAGRAFRANLEGAAGRAVKGVRWPKPR